MNLLEYLCLNVIAEEFEKFHLAFMVSNVETLKRDLYFLQRQYSFEILDQLLIKSKMKKEFLDYFMNEHLKIFDCRWLTGTFYESVPIGDILCRVPNITELQCETCSDEILENLAKFCPKIVEIFAFSNSITDKGIKYLCKNENGNVSCPKLKRIEVDLNEVTDECLKCLIRDLPSLEKISTEKILKIFYSIHKEDFPGLESVHNYNLVALHLLYYDSYRHLSYYSDLLKICLTVCPRLKSLSCFISNEKQLDFFENVALETLSVEFLQREPQININNFLKSYCCNLTTLNICNCIMSTSVLAVSCPKLEALETDNVTFLEDDSQLVLPSLERCVFRNINDDISSTQACRLLLSSSKLEDLQFYSCFLSSDAKTSILKCCKNYQVILLIIERSILEMNFVKDILSYGQSLKFLDLYDCGFCSAEEKELMEFANALPNKPRIDFYLES